MSCYQGRGMIFLCRAPVQNASRLWKLEMPTEEHTLDPIQDKRLAKLYLSDSTSVRHEW